MKKQFVWLLLAVLLLALLIGATLLYDKFSGSYSGENLIPETRPSETAPKETAPVETAPSGTQADTVPTEPAYSTFAAPDFTVLDYEGNEVKLSDYMGKPIVLNYWATWCDYCKEEMPDFDTAREKYPNVQFLMVNATTTGTETVEKAKKYIETEGFGFTVLFDTTGQAVATYNVTAFPSTFFIDAEGELVARASGMLDLATLEKGIDMITSQ